jgi:hypothetical protein
MSASTPQITYRVVGVRADGSRETISEQSTRDAADRVVNLIQYGSSFKALIIEAVSQGIPIQDLKNPA